MLLIFVSLGNVFLDLDFSLDYKEDTFLEPDFSLDYENEHLSGSEFQLRVLDYARKYFPEIGFQLGALNYASLKLCKRMSFWNWIMAWIMKGDAFLNLDFDLYYERECFSGSEFRF
ncbi:hypothetical protein RCL_jg11517.t1 [Rhizophagus clarus]|uniref:Uncharacterized protein n=1 Tax=Rhizophagus clarus TaxID=94130 RepID=A0A8H3QKG6_9GLOM|nr:hypothetical protein RCL_jg11517.t1 [Rhizophagus clarus]